MADALACGEERKGEGLKEERDLGMRVRLLLWKEWWERERTEIKIEYDKN